MNFTGKILVVDDETHIRTYVKLILRQLGQPVITEAKNGEEAIAAYTKSRQDIVLLDVNMPRMDGLETLQRLMQLDPACVVVMLTSLANRETVERALEFGAVNYIRKDTSKEEILTVLREAIEKLPRPA